MSELVALIYLALQPAVADLDGANPAQSFPQTDLLSQYKQFSPKCVTPSVICYISQPKPVGEQCQCPNQSWGTIQP